MRRKTVLVSAIILAAILAAFITGCGANDNDGLNEKVLIYGSGDYTAINPALFEHGEINLLIFLGLTGHDGDNNIVGAAAESWEYDENTHTYTFHLREGLTFHDGASLTAEDVKFTLETIMDPANVSEIAPDFEEIKSISVIDDKTVEIVLSSHNYAILDHLAVGILPKHLLYGEDIAFSDFNRNPVGAGPYRFVAWDMGQSLTLEKFDEFYMGSPAIDKIIFKIVPDPDARVLQLKSGELDFAQIMPKNIKEFRDNSAYRLYIMDTADYRAIMYNMNSDFFSKHRELPNILSYAIDRKSIVDSVLLGYGEIAYSPLQKGPYKNPGMEKFEYDPEKAVALLEAAGWNRGPGGYYQKDGEELAFVINNGQQDRVRIDMSNICAQNLRDIGVNATVGINLLTDWEKQDAYLIGWGSPFDPDGHTYKVFGTGKGSNFSGYSNKDVDGVLLKARQKETYEERLPLYRTFQEILQSDMPYTFIAYIDAVYASGSRITGVNADAVLGHHGVGVFNNICEWDID